MFEEKIINCLQDRPIARFTLELPPSVNALYKNTLKGRSLTQKARDWKLDSEIELIGQIKEQERFVKIFPITGCLMAFYEMNFKDTRRRDIANYEKAVSDVMTSNGIIEDDSQFEIMCLTKNINKNIKYPFVNIKIYNIKKW